MFSRENITDALRFWERGRLLYNLVLSAVSLTVLLFMGVDKIGWVQLAFPLFLLAVFANVVYCVAYPVDLLVQASDFRSVWRDARWVLLALGTLVAVVMAYLTLGGPYVFGVPDMGQHG